MGKRKANRALAEDAGKRFDDVACKRRSERVQMVGEACTQCRLLPRIRRQKEESSQDVAAGGRIARRLCNPLEEPRLHAGQSRHAPAERRVKPIGSARQVLRRGGKESGPANARILECPRSVLPDLRPHRLFRSRRAGAFSLAGGREMGRFSGPACGDIFLKPVKVSFWTSEAGAREVCSLLIRCATTSAVRSVALVDKVWTAAKNPRSEKPSWLIDKSSTRYWA
ncbi:hypothetical protein CEJ86_31710 [Sinorhizobium meliloti]|uniref:Uncharacterized protein n=1 Tax=Rhizobium meliloti TaxID=382 RepID=A0A2J0YTG0_RHIML|nr:hypothetical protein CEJ86_31710 [Sinorhizobium meliloti]